VPTGSWMTWPMSIQLTLFHTSSPGSYSSESLVFSPFFKHPKSFLLLTFALAFIVPKTLSSYLGDDIFSLSFRFQLNCFFFSLKNFLITPPQLRMLLNYLILFPLCIQHCLTLFCSFIW
jgi:hypothetical protein